MNTKIFIINITDSHHSVNSFRLVGAATSIENCIKLINKNQTEWGDPELSEEYIEQVHNIQQTQGLGEDYEYNIEEVTLNELV